MKRYVVILIFAINFFSFGFCVGQHDTGFENQCNPGYSDTFSNGCIPDWVRVSGTPNTLSNEPGVIAPEGSRYVHALSVTLGTNLPSVGESYALNHDFDECKEYTLEYQISFKGNHPTAVQFILANDLPSSQMFILPPIDLANMEIINVHNFSSTTSWGSNSITFIPEKNYSQLWVRTEMLSGPTSTWVNSFLDDVSINVSNFDPPAFYTMDEDGNVTSSFCYGEDVKVCIGKADYDWTKTLFTIFKNPLSSSSFSKTDTRFDVEKGCYNLSEFIREAGNKLFEPGFSYEIKMSVYVPDCGWYDYYKTIYVDCCEESNAGFEVDITGDAPHSRTIKVTANRDYIYYDDDEQEFCLSIDDDFDGVYEEIGCWQASSFDYDIDLCMPYRITHTVSTLCGDDESTQDIYIDENCEECSITEFRCSTGAGGAVSYFWTSTPDVETYEAELNFNDSDCDCGKGLPDQIPILVPMDGNFFFFALSPCLSIRIRPICEDGMKGEWSEKLCSDDCTFIDHLINNETNTDFSSLLLEEMSVNCYPTPFIDHLNIEMNGPMIINTKYQIFDLKGSMMLEGQLLDNRVNINTNELRAGNYIIFIKSDDHIIYADKLSKI